MPMPRAVRPAATRSTSAQDIGAVPVSAVMARDVPVVDPEDPVIEVWQRLQNLDSPVAVVRDGNRIVAVVSQRTLAMWWPSGGPREMHRRRAMSSTPGFPPCTPIPPCARPLS
jgi:CBS-domain-containing membrane protein